MFYAGWNWRNLIVTEPVYNSKGTSCHVYSAIVVGFGDAGGAKKRVGGRAVDTALPQPAAVSTISLAHPGFDAVAYHSGTASGSGGRTGSIYPPPSNYSTLSVQTNTMPTGTRLASSAQPSQLNFALQVQSSNAASSHSSSGTRTGGTQRPQVEFSSFSDR